MAPQALQWTRYGPRESSRKCLIWLRRCLAVGAERSSTLRSVGSRDESARPMSLLAQRLLDVHDALTRAQLPHAFGGAIALAYCTHEPRGTRDLDVNVFVDPTRASEVLAALPDGVAVTDADIQAAAREGQVRVWWEDTPVDLFLNLHRFHDEVAAAVRLVPFEDRTIPVLGCTTLAVFKALFDRTKDWADIEEIAAAGALDLASAEASLEQLLGADSPAVRRLAALAG